MPDETKRCGKCGEEKAFDQFYRRQASPDGYQHYCKECSSANSQQRTRQLKDGMLAAYGRKCACCGESRPDFLTLDHVNNDGADRRRELRSEGGYSPKTPLFGFMYYDHLRRLGWPNRGYAVMCFNCNNAKSALGICPHELERQQQQAADDTKPDHGLAA